jgi:hypothetical protein
MTSTQIVDALSSFYFPDCSSVLATITGLRWRIGFEPGYIESEDDPPIVVPPDAEMIPIDGYLGMYCPQTRRIVIYMRAITTTAPPTTADAHSLHAP